MAGLLGTIRGQVTLDVRQAVAAYATLRSQNARTVYALRGTGDSMVSAGRTMATAGGAMVYAFGKVVNAAAEFERKLDFFGAVSGATKKQMAELSKYALQLGQDTIYSANEIADGFIELGKSGITAKKIIEGVGEAMTSLGAAGDIPLVQSGQIITSTIAQFNLEAKNASHIADLLAGAANASIADITDIGYSLKYVGGIANTAGLKLEDVTTAIALLAQAGIKGSTAGTTLRQMIVSLPGVTENAYGALKEMGIILEDGTNRFYDQQGTLKPLSKVYEILGNAMSGYTKQQKTQTLRTLFQTRALSAASVLIDDGAEGFKKMYKEMSKVKAADVASARLDNLSGDIEILKGNIETLVIQAGGPFQNMLRGWVKQITKLVQAYGNLDPKTQELIVSTIAITGVLLVLMGIVSIIIGTILKFAASMIKLGAGVRFLWGLFGGFLGALKIVARFIAFALLSQFAALAAALGITVGALAAIVAVVALVVVGLVIAYKKFDGFRNVVNSVASALWNGIKAIASFFKNLVTNPGKAWNSIKKLFSNMGKMFKSLGSLIGRGVQSGLAAVGRFVLMVVAFFGSLPGKILGKLSQFFSQLRELFTLKNVAYAIGFAIGTIVRLFISLALKIFSAARAGVIKIIKAFAEMGPRIGNAIQAMAKRVAKLMVGLGVGILRGARNIVTGTINWFRQLPGRIGAFVARMAGLAISKFTKFKNEAPAKAAELVNKFVSFFKSLPDRVINWIVKTTVGAMTWLGEMRDRFIGLGKTIGDGLIAGIKALPGLVGGILQNCIDAIKDKITDAFNAVQDFGESMWNGFKSGLGIHSPSYIEKAMFKITKVTDEETKKMKKNVLRIQGIAKDISKTSFEPVTPDLSQSAREYGRLASMHRANQKRAQVLTGSSGRRPIVDARRNDRKNDQGNELKMRITNWREGTGWFRGIAQDAIDDDQDYSDTLGRMG